MFHNRAILLLWLVSLDLALSLKLSTNQVPDTSKTVASNVYYLQDYCFEFEVDQPEIDEHKLLKRQAVDDPKEVKHPAAEMAKPADKTESTTAPIVSPTEASKAPSTTAAASSEVDTPKSSTSAPEETPKESSTSPPAPEPTESPKKASTSVKPAASISPTPKPAEETTSAPVTTTTAAPKEDKNPFANFQKFFGLDISRFMNYSTGIVGSQLDMQSKFANKTSEMKFFKKRSVDSSEYNEEDSYGMEHAGGFDFHYFMDKAGKLVRKEIKARRQLLEKQIDLQKKIAKKYAKQLVKEARKHFKQIHLDPVVQPSIVIRSWRHTLDDGQTDNTSRIRDFDLDEIQVRKSGRSKDKLVVKKCGILLRLPEDTQISTSNQGNSDKATLNFGTVVNLLDLKQKTVDETETEDCLLCNSNLRILSSDPNMTQYWFQGEKLKVADQNGNDTGDAEEDPDSLDISVVNQDTLIDPILKAIADEEAVEETKTHPDERWILIELDMNGSDAQSGPQPTEQKPSPKEAEAAEKQNVELVVNLYGTSKPTAQPDSKSANTKAVCPVGTFDCNMDGLQCIPNSLRCNGEDNCGNRNDELYNCGTINLYYIFGSPNEADFDFFSEGFWFSVRVLWILFMIAGVLYLFSILFRWFDKRCCKSRRDYRRRDYLTEASSYKLKKGANKGQFGPGNSWLNWTQHASQHARNSSTSSSGSSYDHCRHGSAPPPYPGMDNARSMVHENIYVNNNYGQPQGSTVVHTSGGPPNTVPSFSNANDYSPLYPKQFPTYGGTQAN